MIDSTNAVIPTVAERLLQVLDHLGVSQAHFCMRTTLDMAELVAAAPQRVASITVQGAWNSRPEDVGTLGNRTLWLLGDQGEAAKRTAQRFSGPPALNVRWLEGYQEFPWSNTVADRFDEVSRAMLDFLTKIERDAALPAVELSGEGEIAEVSYRATGKGTPVVLLPLGLSARQWDPLLPALQGNHCTILLGGKHLEPVATLERRAASDYSRMALQLLDLATPQATDSLIEVGCGSGALLRRIALRAGMRRVVGLDVNTFLLREARALAAQEGLAERLELHEGSAEAIPFPDGSFEVAFSSTVMEEVDAERMLAEMVRITKPGGRVAVAVRAVDRGPWTNLPLPAALKQKVEEPSGDMTGRGCADDSLCRRFNDAGLTNVRGGPAWAWARPADPWWTNLEAQTRGGLSGEEYATWNQALATAQVEGLPVWFARPFHCAVGTKQ